MKTLVVSFMFFVSFTTSAANDCGGVESAQGEFIRLLDQDAKALKALPAPNEESEKCNILLGTDRYSSSDSYTVLSKMPEKFSSYIKREVEQAKRKRLSYDRVAFFEASMVKCYCQQRSMRLSKAHQPSKYGILPSNSCSNIEDVQKVFKSGFEKDSDSLKKSKDKGLVEGFRLIKEREQSMCQWLSKKSRFADDDTDTALTSIQNKYSTFIRDEMSKAVKAGMSPYNSRSLGLAMARCYCLERSLEK